MVSWQGFSHATVAESALTVDTDLLLTLLFICKEACMNSTVTVKYQTTIPKEVREQLGIAVNDALEWIVDKGKVIVQPVHNAFLRHQGSIKTGSGEILADIQAARDSRMERYR